MVMMATKTNATYKTNRKTRRKFKMYDVHPQNQLCTCDVEHPGQPHQKQYCHCQVIHPKGKAKAIPIPTDLNEILRATNPEEDSR